MYIPTKLKLNRFKSVSIPSAREMYIKFRGNLPTDNSAYSGDESVSDGRKLDVFSSIASMDAKHLREESETD